MHERVLRDDALHGHVAEDARAVGVGEDEVVEARDEPRRGGRVGGRQRRTREVEERGAGLVAEAPQAHLFQHVSESPDALEPGPLREVRLRRGAERREVAAHELLARFRFVRLRAADRRIGRLVHTLAVVAPRPGRRRVHDVRVALDATPEKERRHLRGRVRLEERAHLLPRSRPVAQLDCGLCPELRDPSLRDQLLVRRRPVAGAERAPRRGKRPEVARRDEVQRPRMSRLLTTERRSSARVSCARSKPWRRAASVRYGEGVYCAWSPASASTARGTGSFRRSSRSCRASSARFSSALVRTRSATTEILPTASV